MRRDRPDRDDATERKAELLTAYVDGVAELTPAERHRLAERLARDPRARADQAAVRRLLERLRALPPVGAEPDWEAMERSIHQAVERALPQPWWRSWKWLAPAMTFATAAAVLLVLWSRPPRGLEPAVWPADHLPRDGRPGEDVVALWLDGHEVEVDVSASDMLGDAVPGDADPALVGDDSSTEVDLLPSTDLAWVDDLDEDALDRAEHWLAKTKG
ncbi:MAG TPA: hypothetical protein VHN14_07905 [Kofleriaceae bacterium]|jgi:anti-sigma factor RsiW|nr:hypothetical protein [Kofleriaceae bacterium]